ncbi:MAG: hypothetical protein H8F28_27040 [Fibrella sp.]|nr:hypothetical protein [Armatimonadota bacterium]
MRVVIKPAGLFILIAIAAILFSLILFGILRPRPAAVAQKQLAKQPVTSATDIYTGQTWELLVLVNGIGGMTENMGAVPGATEPVKIYTLTLNTAPKEPWQFALHLPTPAPVVKGEKLRLTFRARSKDAVPVVVNFEQNSLPYAKSVTQDESTTGEWKQYSVEFNAVDDYAPEASQVAIHCGLKVGTLEIADLHLYRIAQ